MCEPHRLESHRYAITSNYKITRSRKSALMRKKCVCFFNQSSVYFVHAWLNYFQSEWSVLVEILSFTKVAFEMFTFHELSTCYLLSAASSVRRSHRTRLGRRSRLLAHRSFSRRSRLRRWCLTIYRTPPNASEGSVSITNPL